MFLKITSGYGTNVCLGVIRYSVAPYPRKCHANFTPIFAICYPSVRKGEETGMYLQYQLNATSRARLR
jgi:hypothetical protein